VCRVEEQVFRLRIRVSRAYLEISMSDTHGVEVLDTKHKLFEITIDLLSIVESVGIMNLVIEVSSRTKLHDNTPVMLFIC
jgi:hypothetical protein